MTNAYVASSPALKTFTVVYRMGGRVNCTWKRTLPILSAKEADEKAEAIERGGRRALVFMTHRLDAIGMPEGWDWEVPRRG